MCEVLSLGKKFNTTNIKPLWMDILYRIVELECNKTNSKFKSGNKIEALEYYLALSQFDNTSINPLYQQYYQFGPSGLFRLTSCYDDIPLFVSFKVHQIIIKIILRWVFEHQIGILIIHV